MGETSMWSRRQFIKVMGAVGGALVAPFQRLGRVEALELTERKLPPGAELYGDFLLLQEGTPIPDFVQDYKFGIPSMCGVTEEQDGLQKDTIMAAYFSLDSAASLSKEGGFPVYTLNSLPKGIAPSGTGLIKHKTGEVFGGNVTFEAYDEQTGNWYTALNISIQVDFPQPFPLWSSTPVEPDGPATVLEKVDFTPGGHGVLVYTPQGFALHWIARNTCFLMTGDRMPNMDVRELASALILAS
jgi:hypothetical protein